MSNPESTDTAAPRANGTIKPRRSKTRNKRIQSKSSKANVKKAITEKRRRSSSNGIKKRQRKANRSFPSESFEESLRLAQALQDFAGGGSANRLTLLGKLNISPSSSSTRELISNSYKYGLTIGSFNSASLELTEAGRIVTNASTDSVTRRKTAFELAIDRIDVFSALYEEWKQKKFPAPEFLRDSLRKQKVGEEYLQECADTFTVNCKYLELLQTISGAQYLQAIEVTLAELPQRIAQEAVVPVVARPPSGSSPISVAPVGDTRDWSKTCFYITPIGEEGSEQRRHSDLFLGSLVEPALADLDLTVVRADQIGEPGIINRQVLEFVMKSRLAIVDLSWHNPNAFYEMAVRHVCKLPTVQICRKMDRLPFDVSQSRTIMIDTSDIYSLVPLLQQYHAEIANQARAAISGSWVNENPISIYVPGLEVKIPH